MLPKLISLNCVNFGFQECGFNDCTNNKKDKAGDSRSGSSRATIERETGILYCFTLEGNYSTGLRINTLKPRFDYLSGKKLKSDFPVKDTSSDYYKLRKIPIYTSELYKDVGHSFCVSILDLYEINPQTRLVKNQKEKLSDALTKIREDIKRDIIKPSTFKSKKKSKAPVFELVLNEE